MSDDRLKSSRYCCEDSYASADEDERLHTWGCENRCGMPEAIPQAAERGFGTYREYACALTVGHEPTGEAGGHWLFPAYRLPVEEP